MVSTLSIHHAISFHYVVRIIHNVHVQVMEAEKSITLTVHTSENVFIALGWRSENDYGFYV